MLSLNDFTNLMSEVNYASYDNYLTTPANCKVHSKLTLPYNVTISSVTQTKQTIPNRHEIWRSIDRNVSTGRTGNETFLRR